MEIDYLVQVLKNSGRKWKLVKAGAGTGMIRCADGKCPIVVYLEVVKGFQYTTGQNGQAAYLANKHLNWDVSDSYDVIFAADGDITNKEGPISILKTYREKLLTLVGR